MNKEDFWDITNKEQTQLKLNILGQYLKQWAAIIGENFQEGYYIDCFAGRGKYHKNGIKDSISGSPLIAQQIGLEVQEKKQKKDKNFRFKLIAIESDKENFDDLNRFLKENDPEGKVHVNTMMGEFQQLIPSVIKEIGSSPAFFFIDPTGIKTIPKDVLDSIVDRAVIHEKTEIFLNYMHMGVKRVAGLQKIADHKKESIRLRAIKSMEHLDKLFGDKGWIDKEDRELLIHFCNQVLRRGYKVILNFDVPYPDKSGTFYNLIFATNNPTAERIMSYIFSKKLFEGTLFEGIPFEGNHAL